MFVARGASPLVRGLVAVVAALSSVTMSIGSVESAVAAPVASKPNTEVSVAVEADGTATFSTDPVAPSGSPVAHTPGLDGGSNNGVVRTFDTVRYRVDYNVNEVVATAVTLTSVLPAGVAWLRDPSGLVAPGCLDDAGGSSISADGRTWVCVLGDKAQGTAGTIFPTAQVRARIDSDVVPMSASLDSAETAAVVSNVVEVTVSSSSRANWVKQKPEEYKKVINGGVEGRLYVFPFQMNAGSGGQKGSGPLDDTYTYTMFDNAWGLATGAVLAPQALMDTYAGGRINCGGYDGVGDYPFGRTFGTSNATNTTPGGLAGGTVTCTDGPANDYSVKIDIAGQITSTSAEKVASGKLNSQKYVISSQIAWWVPEAELRLRAGAPPSPANFAAGLNLGNDLSGTQQTVTYPPNPAAVLTPPTPTPINVRAQPATVVPESSVTDNQVQYLTLFEDSTPGGGIQVRSWSRFFQGPYRENVAPRSTTGIPVHGLDTRPASQGGLSGGLPGAQTFGDGGGTVSRDEVVTITTAAVAFGNRNDYMHTCTGLDTTFMELVPFPATFPVSNTNIYFGNPATTSQSAGTSNSGPLAHAFAGKGALVVASPVGAGGGGSTFQGVYDQIGVKIQFARTKASYKASPPVLVGEPNANDPSAAGASVPTGTVGPNVDTQGLSCNNDDADARGWVDSTGDLSVFDADSDGRYEGINLIRVSSLQPLQVSNAADGGMFAHFQARVKRDRAANPNGSELYVHSSRAYGAWDKASENSPFVGDFGGDCYDNQSNSRIDPDTVGITGPDSMEKGWCGMPYNTVNETAGLDQNSLEYFDTSGVGDIAAYHTDRLTIVEARPAVTKVNNDGLSDFVRNGDTATFTVRPQIIGSPADTVADVKAVDTLPATMSFVSASPPPTSVAGQVLTWSYGDQVGGWTAPPIVVTVKITNAGPNAALQNTVAVSGVMSGDAARTTKSSSAFAYTPPAYREATLAKSVLPMKGACQRFPSTPGTASFPTAVAAEWAKTCSMTSLDGPLNFQLSYANTGSEDVTDFRIVDVFPYVGDATEPQDSFTGTPDSNGAGNDGDGRTPPSAFSGTVGFGSLTGMAATDTVLYTADPPATVKRDPDEASTTNTWCTATSAGTKTFGTGACPTGNATVTGIMVRRPTFGPGTSNNLSLSLTTTGNKCDDLYTNTSGARASGTPRTAPTPTDKDIRLEQRSNDVSAMVNCKVDLALTKKIAAASPAPFYPGSKITFDVAVTNQGERSIAPVTVSDYVPAGFTYKAADNANAWGTADVTGPGTVTRILPGPIALAATTTTQIVLTVDTAVVAPKDLVNRAEISRFDTDNDPTNGDSGTPDTLDVPGDFRTTFTDLDSTPDTDAANDVGGAPGTATDDLITSTATSGTNPDEDDADPALVAISPSPDLTLAKTLDTAGPFFAGKTIQFTLTPKNIGVAPAKTGWTVTEILPTGLTAVSMSGTGYTCTASVCTAGAGLAAGASGGSITVTATITAGFTGALHNVAYVSPAAGDTPESIVLDVPTTSTNTDTSTTNNDAQADLAVGSLVSVGDYAWIDANADGQQTAGEKPLPGVTVELKDSTGVSVGTTTTDAAGFYSFKDLVPGAAYTLTFTGPTGYSLTVAKTGAAATDSDPNAGTGVAAFTAPATGTNSLTTPDLPTLDAGFVSVDLSLAKAVTSAGPYYAGSTVTYTLTPKNEGTSTAKAGWKVTEILPTGLTIATMSGTGYDCTALPTCTAAGTLAAGATGPVLTVTATVNTSFSGAAHNVANVVPAAGEVPELNVLVTPVTTTDTATTATNNDAQADITVKPLISVGDFVWLDTDRDGIQDAGEPGKAGVTVVLKDDLGATVATTTTDSAGFYSFKDLLPSTKYTVTFTAPSGLKFTTQTAGTDTTLDSDADPVTGVASFTTLATGKNLLAKPDLAKIDAGLVTQTYAVGDYVWYDIDRDGVQDAGESPVPGVKVTLVNPDGSAALDENGVAIAAATTDAAGKYVIDKIPAGSYLVKFTSLPSGATFTGQNAAAGTAATNSDAATSTGTTGTVVLSPSATGVRATVAADGVTADYINPTIDAGILRIDLALAKAETSSGPYYAGSTVTYSLTPKNNGPVDALAGWKVTDILPTDLTLVTMSGTGYSCVGDSCTATAGLAAGATGGVITVTATVKKPFDGAVHNVAYIAPAAADTGESNALVVPTTSTDTTATATNNDAQADLSVVPLVSVGDFVWQDNNRDGIQTAGEPGVAGVTVTLKDAAGAVVGTTTTNSAGFYSFTDLKAGKDYTVTFTALTNTSFTITGAGTTATDSDAVPATGIAAFTAPAAGANSATAPDLKTVDAGLVPATYAVSDFVWYDTDRDGVQDTGETAVAGVTVTLVNPDGTPAKNLAGTVIAAVTTDATGKYVIDDIPAGAYQVKFTTVPTGATFTIAGAGTAATDSTAIPATGTTSTFTLSATAPNVRAAVAADGLSKASFINPTIDAGLLRIDLELAKALTATGPFYSGSTVTYSLTPKNNGPVDALSGWKVTEVLPADLTLVDMAGAGYNCAATVCTANSGLAAGATGGVITVTATVNKPFDGAARNLAYISPAVGETGESNALSVPTVGTDALLSATNNDAQADLVVSPLVSVGDFVWQDSNRDGIQTSGEPGIKDVVVTLKDAAGAVVATTTTNAAGFYSFTDLKSGKDYTVTFTPPAGATFTPTGAGTTSTDSDAAPATGIATFTAPATGANSATAPDLKSIDAGIVPATFAVGDFVWSDTNRDGIQDAGELGIKDVTVTLLNPDGTPAKNLAGVVIAAVKTDAAGHYVIDDIPAGDYQVKFTTVPAGAAFTQVGAGTPATDSGPDPATATTPTFTVGLTAAGMRPVVAADGATLAKTIQPTIDAGLLSIDLALTKTMTATGPFYSGSTITFQLVPRNNGPVDAIAGFKVTDVLPTDLLFVSMSGAGYTCTGQTCTATAGLAAATNGPPITVTVKAAKPFDGVANNVAYITPAATDVGEANPLGTPPTAATDTSGTATNNDAQADLIVDPLVSVGDFVWQDNDRDGVQDAGEPGLNGVTVTLKDKNGVTVATTTTNSTGFYSFVDLESGQPYTITFTKPADTVFTVTGAGTTATDSDPDPTTGVVSFTAPIVAGGNSPTAPDLATIDAGITPKTYAVSNVVWYDTDRDGIQDAAETAGVAGVTVTLVNADGTPAKNLAGVTIAAVTTDADGLYVIDDVPAGTYLVKFTTLPSGATLTGDGAGTAATDSDPDPTTATTPAFTLGSAEPNVRPVATADGTSLAAFIDPTVDAGVVRIDLELAKTLITTGKVYAGSTVTFELTPSNTGPVDALPGWKVTEVLPAGLTVVNMTGTGYTCSLSATTCTSSARLAAGATGATITVTAKVDKPFDGTAHNVAYIAPVAGETGEIKPLVVPTTTTDTSTTATNNDAQADLVVDPLVSVGDYVWRDTNRDGIQDASESGIAGIVVTLTDAAGVTVATTTTDAAGFYSFTDLKSGLDYTITFTTPTGMKLSPTGAGTTSTDSDADPATGAVTFTAPIVAGGNSATSPDLDTIDAGLIPKTFAVSNLVWHDLDRDGIQDATEPGIPGVTVTLVNADGTPAQDLLGNPIAAVTTDADGLYVIDDVPAGAYRVIFTTLPSGATFTPASAGSDTTVDSDPAPATGTTPAFTLGVGATNTRAVTATDTGITAAEYVNPTVDAGIAVIDLELAKTVTSSGPYYAGSTITFELVPTNNGPANTLAGWQVTEVLPASLTLVSISGTGYTCVAATATCTATAMLAAGSDGPPITVTAKIVKPFDGDVRNVAYVKASSSDTGETNSLVVPAAGTDTAGTATNNDAHADLVVDPLVSVGDFVWLDANRDGIQDAGETGRAGITVTLKDGAGNTVATTITDSAGFYSFVDLKSGQPYTITITTPAGLKLSPTGAGTGATDSDADPTTGVISFTAPIVAGGNSATAPDLATLDAGLIAKTFAVSDRVWFDADRDGIQDAAEAGIAGVTVTLVKADGSPAVDANGAPIAAQVTAADGLYFFDDVPAGQYYVAFTTVPAGMQFTQALAGTDRATDSDAEPATGKTAVFTLGVGAANTRPVTAADTGAVLAEYLNPTIDAGITPVQYAVGDSVWIDADKDGVRDASEKPQAGVTVNLIDAAGKTIATTKTDKNGRYVFDAVAAGTYTVQFTGLPKGATLTKTGAGTASTDSDPIPTSTGTSGTTAPFEVGPTAANQRPATGADGLVATVINPTIDAGIILPTFAVSNVVWIDTDFDGVRDASERVLGGVRVELLDAQGRVIKTTLTDKNGRYLFDTLPAGTYRIRVVKPAGYDFTTSGTGGNTATNSDVNAFGTSAPFTLSADSALVTTAVGGVKATYYAPTLVGAGLIKQTFSLGDLVFADLNGNGIQDPTDRRLTGVTVTLLDASGKVIATTKTDKNGNYRFTGLAAGKYRIKITPPAGYTFTGQAKGSNRATDSNINGSGLSDLITLGEGQPGTTKIKPGTYTNFTIDAGLVPGTPPTPGKPLARTGNPINPATLLLAAGLMGTGGVITYTARKRRRTT